MIDPPGWKSDMGAPDAASGTKSNALSAWKCLGVTSIDSQSFPELAINGVIDGKQNSQPEFHPAGFPLFREKETERSVLSRQKNPGMTRIAASS